MQTDPMELWEPAAEMRSALAQAQAPEPAQVVWPTGHSGWQEVA